MAKGPRTTSFSPFAANWVLEQDKGMKERGVLIRKRAEKKGGVAGWGCVRRARGSLMGVPFTFGRVIYVKQCCSTQPDFLCQTPIHQSFTGHFLVNTSPSPASFLAPTPPPPTPPPPPPHQPPPPPPPNGRVQRKKNPQAGVDGGGWIKQSS